MTYKNDPKLIKSRFITKCATCGKTIKKGEEGYYFPSNRAFYCLSCGEDDYNTFLESKQDEDFYNSQY